MIDIGISLSQAREKPCMTSFGRKGCFFDDISGAGSGRVFSDLCKVQPGALVGHLSPLSQPLIPSSLTIIVTVSSSRDLYLPFSSRYNIVGFRANVP